MIKTERIEGDWYLHHRVQEMTRKGWSVALITSHQRGYSGAGGLVGGALFGPVGLLGGFLTRQQVYTVTFNK